MKNYNNCAENPAPRSFVRIYWFLFNFFFFLTVRVYACSADGIIEIKVKLFQTELNLRKYDRLKFDRSPTFVEISPDVEIPAVSIPDLRTERHLLLFFSFSRTVSKTTTQRTGSFEILFCFRSRSDEFTFFLFFFSVNFVLKRSRVLSNNIV